MQKEIIKINPSDFVKSEQAVKLLSTRPAAALNISLRMINPKNYRFLLVSFNFVIKWKISATGRQAKICVKLTYSVIIKRK